MVRECTLYVTRMRRTNMKILQTVPSGPDLFALLLPIPLKWWVGKAPAICPQTARSNRSALAMVVEC